MNKPPYFPFYVRDFASDGKVEAMSTQEVGAYILLLCKAWMEEPAGTLPNNDLVLARWARLDTSTWEACKSSVLSCFALNAADGRYWQKRMREEYSKLLEALKAKSRGGKRGAATRWGENGSGRVCMGESDVCDNTLTSLPMASGCGSESGSDLNTHTHTPKKGVQGEGANDFARFWAAYPRRVNRDRAEKAWKKLKPSAELVQTILTALELHKRSPQWLKEEGQFVPHASTWLNGKQWEDEVILGQPSSNGQRATTASERLAQAKARREATP